MHAYGTVIFFSDTKVEIVEEVLSHEANLVNNWLSRNNLIFSIKVKQNLQFTEQLKSLRLPSGSVTVNGNLTNKAASYKYLGTTLDNHLKVSFQIDKIYK